MRVSGPVVLVLLCAGISAPAAGAVDETCRGQSATIVGEPGATVNGTDGDDVIVTNGAYWTYAGAGDDTVCVVPPGSAPFVDAGDGDDVVDTTAVHQRTLSTRVELGAGSDVFVGGNGRDDVTTGRAMGGARVDDADVDRVTTGRGHDTVVTGQAGVVNHDDVDLGGGNDHLNLRSDHNDGTLDGGTAVNRVIPEFREPGDWVVDEGAAEIRLAGAVVSRWTRIAVSGFDGDPDVSVRYVGSGGDDHLEVSGIGLRSADLGAGDDYVFLLGLRDTPRDRIAGGPGHDSVLVYDTGPVDLDLGRHTLSGYRVAGNEYYRAAAPDVRMIGSVGADDFSYDGCTVLIRGAGGDDRVSWSYSGYTCRRHTQVRAFGGPGDDFLAGSPYRDHLSGGPGTDVARGRDGIDWCRAERRIACET